MNEMTKRLLDKLSAANERRTAAVEARKALLDSAEAEERAELTEGEDTEFRTHTATITEVDEEIRTLTERVEELQNEEQRAETSRVAAARVAAFQPPTGGAQVINEDLTYRKGNGRSYIADLTKSLILHDPEAAERMARHAREVRDAPEFLEVRAAANLSRTDGNGGFFVPPAWLMSQWVALARAGRPTADLIGSQALPPGTDSINIPKVLSGTAADIQTADNAAVNGGNEQAFTDTSIAVPVKTIAGQQTMAIQLLDQSPLNFDEIIFRDLVADYATKTDVQVIAGTGPTGNQVKGILTTASTKTAAVSALTGIGVYSAVANVVQQVHTSRFLSPQCLVMHPRRWAWLQVQVDANGRPLVLPRSSNPQNNTGNVNVLAAQGPVGDMMGLPVILDASIPTNRGSGTNEDVILVLRPDDLLFYESSIRSRVLPEVASANLSVVVQVYGYLAFSAERYTQASGWVTGLTTPSF